ncbi:hypothetical protein MFUL124B02_34010 [Myxococcus fulvus 124B02]|nr:hypothetical protein MFUL124B02_34010 [Myxococcus fulvus 124B02]
MSKNRQLILITHGTTLERNDGRALAVVHGMERALSGLRLEQTVTKTRQMSPLPRRDEWLSEATKEEPLPFLCNGDEGHPVMISGRQKSARLSPGGQPLFEVHANLPLDVAGTQAAADVLEAVAEGAQAYWGHASPDDYGLEISEQYRRSPDGPERSRRGLPMLLLPWHLRAPELPHYLGWVNYWSAATASMMGFPDPRHDAELLTRARRTTSGGWVVRLTDTPLDYDNPAHLETLLRTYERFPEIGGRVSR